MPGSDGVLYVGDSLGVGVRDFGHLSDHVPHIEWDVEEGRNSIDGLAIIKSKLNQGHGTVVFDLGTNDSSASITQHSFSNCIEVVGNRNVVVATVSETPQIPEAKAKNNAILNLASHNSNVSVVDWNSKRTALSGGLHPDASGYVTRANLFADVLNNLEGTDPVHGQPAGGSTTTSGVTSGFNENDLFAIGRASALSTIFELPGLENTWESQQLRGVKSIYNDEPIMGFIEQLSKASLRQFQSLPDGSFFAFFPDQFGIYGHRTPYWNIDDIEIINAQIEITDEALATHVFVAGDTVSPDGQIDIFELSASKGVITIFDAFTSAFMINQGATPKDPERQKDIEKTAGFERALNFLRKYGVRPHFEEAPFIRNPFFEIFYAFTQFQLLWANQYQSQVAFTFMPELYPGGIVALDQHGLQFYVDSVRHSFDYESGFTTEATLSAPSALAGSPFADQMVHPFLTGKD